MLYPVELQNQLLLKKPCKDNQNINTAKGYSQKNIPKKRVICDEAVMQIMIHLC
jgi:hypothetical protein